MTPFLLLAVLGGQAAATAPFPAPQATAAAPIAGADETRAIKVRSVAAEYVWLREHGLRATEQSLVIRGRRAFDVLKATDVNGVERDVWFDISSFYGRELSLLR